MTNSKKEITKPGPQRQKTCQPVSVVELVNAKSIFENIGSRNERAVCPSHGEFIRFDAKVKGEWIKGECHKCTLDAERELYQLEREEFEKVLMQEKLAGSGIPKRFLAKTFENYKIATPGQRTAIDICQKYASNFEVIKENGTSLVLCGKPGTGKTHLACAIGNHLIISHNNVKFIGAFRAIQTVKETYSKSSDKTEQEVIESLAGLDLLILDEIGVQYGTDAEKLILFEVINRRYEDMKPTILISNLQIDDLSKYIGERVMDRMKEGGGPVIAFDWDSSRK